MSGGGELRIAKTCETCRERIWWTEPIGCWVHDQNPADGHDAEPDMGWAHSPMVETVAKAIFAGDDIVSERIAWRSSGHTKLWGAYERMADAVLAVPAVADALTDAARLRSLAATFDSHLNRVKTYTGAQVAAMLRDGGE